MLARLFELVIFDNDGVLVDSELISNRVMAAAISEVGVPTTVEDSMREFMGRRWEDSLAIVEGKLGRALPQDFSTRYRERRDAALAAELRPVDGVADAIARIPCERCVASSGAPEKIRFTLEHTGLLHLFEGRMFSGVEVERGKPAPDLFLHAAERMGVEPARCAVVEDTLFGVEAAVAAGMPAFAYAWYFEPEALEAAGATPFRSMEELPGLLGF
ncbi:MAG TPA: HAD family hydrolase [Solirubrobacterales bacterium]|nr:HAD family hydrolase [Solirubrobacterales bacterium]